MRVVALGHTRVGMPELSEAHGRVDAGALANVPHRSDLIGPASGPAVVWLEDEVARRAPATSGSRSSLIASVWTSVL